MAHPHIVVVGSSNTDMVVKSARIPVPGETVTGGEFVCVPGGKGANQAVAAARLGAQVTFVAKVGDDLFGRQAIEGYQREGINVEHIGRSKNAPTGVALILVDDAGENLISVASGANHAFMPEDIERIGDVICSASVLMLQLEIPEETAIAAAKIAYDAGVPVILDPAPTPEGQLNPELLQRVSYLTPNENEAERLTGIPVTDEESAKAAATKLLSYGPENVFVTLGAAGTLAASRAGTIMIAGFPVNAVDSTAAGDAFNGGLAVAVGAGKSVKEAVLEANAAGALATTKLGAQPSLPRASELKELIDQFPSTLVMT